MEMDEKEEFAKRMNQIADMLGVPPKGKNRQKALGMKFGVSQESARRWLAGESYPRTGLAVAIVKKAGIRYEWFMTGRGSMFDEIGFADTAPESKVLQAMQRMNDETKIKLITITETLAEPAPTQKRLGGERRQRENTFTEELRKLPHFYKKDNEK